MTAPDHGRRRSWWHEARAPRVLEREERSTMPAGTAPGLLTDADGRTRAANRQAQRVIEGFGRPSRNPSSGRPRRSRRPSLSVCPSVRYEPFRFGLRSTPREELLRPSNAVVSDSTAVLLGRDANRPPKRSFAVSLGGEPFTDRYSVDSLSHSASWYVVPVVPIRLVPSNDPRRPSRTR